MEFKYIAKYETDKGKIRKCSGTVIDGNVCKCVNRAINSIKEKHRNYVPGSLELTTVKE